MALILLPLDLSDKPAVSRGGRRSGTTGTARTPARKSARTSAAAVRRTSSARHIQARALRAKEML
jgi:hypothetical protein